MIINIPSIYLWGLFLLLFIFFIAMSIILNYHWGHYGMNETSKKVARVSYFFVSSLLLAGIIFFIIYYNF